MSTADSSIGAGTAQQPSNAPLSEQAKQAAQDLKDGATAIGETVSQAAREEAEHITTAAKDILDGATDKAKSVIAEQKSAGSDYLETVAKAIHRAAAEFEQDLPQAAQYIRRAGSELSGVATAVRDRDLRELVAEVENVARRQPALFFGGAVIVGFAVLRFLKSAPPKADQPNTVR